MFTPSGGSDYRIGSHSAEYRDSCRDRHDGKITRPFRILPAPPFRFIWGITLQIRKCLNSFFPCFVFLCFRFRPHCRKDSYASPQTIKALSQRYRCVIPLSFDSVTGTYLLFLSQVPDWVLLFPALLSLVLASFD